MPWCPKCGAEFRAGFTVCNTCHVALVQHPAERSIDEPVDMEKPVAVYVAKNRLEAEMVCDMLRGQGIAVVNRPAAFRQIQAYSGADARFGVEVLVDAAQTARARALIDETNRELEQAPLAEEELARLAEEQALEASEQPAEDSASFRLLPVVIGVIAAALVLLYFVSARM